MAKGHWIAGKWHQPADHWVEIREQIRNRFAGRRRAFREALDPNSSHMELASFWTNSFRHQVCSFQEVLDWRFLVLGDFLLVSFVNCT
ncbi:hypothetical protein SDJN02_09410, partial [Cucurbita argyrosperma subsp. argyrosperma]